MLEVKRYCLILLLITITPALNSSILILSISCMKYTFLDILLDKIFEI